MKNLSQMYPWTDKSPLNFDSHRDPESAPGLPIGSPDLEQILLGGGMRSRSALVYNVIVDEWNSFLCHLTSGLTKL